MGTRASNQSVTPSRPCSGIPSFCSLCPLRCPNALWYCGSPPADVLLMSNMPLNRDCTAQTRRNVTTAGLDIR